MVEELVAQFMKSGAGADLLAQLGQKGIDAGKAQSAVAATAQGAVEQLGQQAGGLGSLAGLGQLASGLLGGTGGAPNGGALQSLVQPVSAFVASKTGLQPAMATMIVSAALPKLMELIQGKGGGAGASGALGGIADTVRGLF